METITGDTERAKDQAADEEVRIIRVKEMLHICGLKRSSVYEMMKAGRFPTPIKIGVISGAPV